MFLKLFPHTHEIYAHCQLLKERPYICSFIQLSNQLLQQHYAKNPEDTGEELQVMFASGLRMGKMCDLSDFIHCVVVVPGGVV